VRLALCSLALVLLARASASQSARPPRDSARVAAVIAAARAESHAAGLVAAVLRTGREPVIVADGVANAARGTPLRGDALLAIGSITKELTAAAVMQLAESGRLSLEDSVQRWLPAFGGAGRTVTIGQLLAHTSGLHGSLRPVSAGALPDATFDFPPGTSWGYSNAGYLLLGRIVERATGMPWREIVRTRLAPVAGLRRTMPGPYAVAGFGNEVASGHRQTPDTLEPIQSGDLDAPFTAGGLYATAEDVARWGDALAHGRVVSPASYALMTAPTRLPSGEIVPYGLGIMLSALGRHLEHMHEGDVEGYSAGLASYPDASLTVAVLSNTEGVPALRIARRVAAGILGVAPDSAAEVPLAPTDRAKLLGLYAAGESVACRVVAVGDGVGYTCGPDTSRRMRYRGGGVFEEPGAPEWRLEFTAWTSGRSTHATGWRELYYGLPLTRARWIGAVGETE
jgi:CubicO group peptidase (beta-lactamase class C family)